MDWSLIGKCDRISAIRGSATYWLQFTTGVANTKGSWTELSSALPFDSCLVLSPAVGGAGADALIDVAMGTIGNEQILVSNIIYTHGVNIGGNIIAHFPIPIFIPANTRIIVRGQSTTATEILQTTAIIIGLGGFGAEIPLSACDVYGANETDSGGISIDPGGAANIKGSYVEINASISNTIRGIVLGIGGQANFVRLTCTWRMDLSIGAAGAEQVLIADYDLGTKTNHNLIHPRFSPFFPISIPANTRIAARAQCSITDATDRLFDLVVYGFR